MDWWFAYTQLTAQHVQGCGFPSERITVLDNAIDTHHLIALCDATTARDIAEFRARAAIGRGPIGLFLGSLYPDKRLGFLLDAAHALHRRLPGFVLMVAGAGPDEVILRDAAASCDWIRVLGSLGGQDKAVALCAADIVMNPGLVGLGILDCFAAGRPMVTTDCGIHSPEIAYLEHGRNGLMTGNTLDAFVEGCAFLLTDGDARRAMGEQARSDCSAYSIEHMVERFSSGVEDALALAPRR